MLVRHKTDKTASIYYQGTMYRFQDWLLEAPAALAMYLSGKDECELVESSTVPFNQNTWSESRKTLILDTVIGSNNGYGRAAMDIAQGLIDTEGVDMKLIVRNRKPESDEYSSDELVASVIKGAQEEVDCMYVKLNVGSAFQRGVVDKYIGFTMFEASKVPAEWVPIINNNCESLIVPCEQNVEAFRRSGVTCDIGVVPLSVNTDVFLAKEDYNLDKEGFTFGMMANITHRKGADIARDAFEIAFPEEEYPNVKLHLKTLKKSLPIAPYLRNGGRSNPRIIFDNETFSMKQLVENFFHKIDAFVFPTRGEGFGLPPIEAMSCGLPVICTNWSGPADYLTSRNSYPLRYEMVTVPKASEGGYPEEWYDKDMQWAEPDVDHLVKLMRSVYEDREKAMRKGKQAAKYVRENLTPKHSAEQLINYLETRI